MLGKLALSFIDRRNILIRIVVYLSIELESARIEIVEVFR